VIVAAILAAVVIGVIVMPLIQQQVQGRGGNNGGLLRPGALDRNNLLVQYVEDLFLVLENQKIVIEHIRNDEALTEGQRNEALQYAHDFTAERVTQMQGSLLQRAQNYNNASWYIVRQPRGDEVIYRRALHLAEAAVALAPGTGYYLNTLGVAQYRLGKYREAMKTLLESDRINSNPRANRLDLEGQSGSIPADVAFLAMASFRLGEKEKAGTYLKALREAMPFANLSRVDLRLENEAFLREAEQLIEGKVNTKPKPGPEKKFKAPKDVISA
jgi:tetratricopeptide (TPR) repeat protein